MFPRWFVAGLLALNLRTAPGQVCPIHDEVVRSQRLGIERTIHVYLPASYKTETRRRYPVLYLQDGQNVFSTAGTNCAFGWGSWQLDLTAEKLARAGEMQNIIMVAVDNTTNRLKEYDGRVNPPGTNAPSAFENYAAFLITELKPRIDREYRTKPGPANTGVMGSSMGGLCSLALAWEHPEVFGRAACLSGSFQIEHTNFLNDVLHGYRGKPKPVRIYLDSGTMDFTGGDDNHALTAQAAAELRRIGWGNNLMLYVDDNLLTPEAMAEAGLRRDKWNEAKTSRHNEFYWRLRAWRALTFLFPPDKK
jgi:predicted alpha/beta superfamily hydrolase